MALLNIRSGILLTLVTYIIRICYIYAIDELWEQRLGWHTL